MSPTLRFLRLILLLTSLAAVLSWHTQTILDSQPKPIRLGVSSGAEAEIAYKIKEIALQEDLDIDVRVYGDYLKLNEALARGELDANAFQPAYYLEAVNRDLSYNLKPLTETIFSPLGIYRKQKETEPASFLPAPHSTVLISQEAKQQSRSLALLSEASLITLSSQPGGIWINSGDITANPLELRIIVQSDESLFLSQSEADYLILSPAQAKKHAWQPLPDALLLEKPNANFAHVLATRTTNTSTAALQKLASFYARPELHAFMAERYKGSWLPMK
ncbi:MetQ/NlpA family ABC transporter substrate-binding protein [Azotosporobacter soli]|uniref:MetQ/NlpA family ABC transporter substrate-binding protein n=1 Tax=Azotosporobacter soli TaxID=3055040 RepID=UPI0031FF123A